MKDEIVYVKHIKMAITHVQHFIKRMNKDEFAKNVLVHSAVIRQLEIIGEAVKNLPSGFRKRYDTVPWKEIAGLRDKLIHGYFGVDLSLVWTICVRDIPLLKKNIISILKKSKR